MTLFSKNPEVIVVGAGTAGLSAAKALRNAGIDTVVLEAAGHSGGRCITDCATFSIPFDRGGSWLHSAPINPLARLADKTGTPLQKKDWSWSRVQTHGYTLKQEEVATYCTYQQDMWEAISRRGAQTPDTTPRDAMPEGPFMEPAACSIAQMLAGDADITSAADTYNYAHEAGDWLVEGGLGAFIQRLHRDVPVKASCPVQKIDYSGQEVTVTTADGVLHAPHLILTVSTGVLASGAIEFVPPLPIEKEEALASLPMGLLNKIGLEFDPSWRDASEGEMADYHKGGDEFCSVLFGFFESSLAVGFVAGRFADALEREGAGAATDFCIEGLRAQFGSDIHKHIRHTAETAWRSEAFACGSYSYAKPGCAEAREALAQPLAERVYFAGEATMTDTFSTVHGAYLSGQRAADEVLANRPDA